MHCWYGSLNSLTLVVRVVRVGVRVTPTHVLELVPRRSDLPVAAEYHDRTVAFDLLPPVSKPVRKYLPSSSKSQATADRACAIRHRRHGQPFMLERPLPRVRITADLQNATITRLRDLNDGPPVAELPVRSALPIETQRSLQQQRAQAKEPLKSKGAFSSNAGKFSKNASEIGLKK